MVSLECHMKLEDIKSMQTHAFLIVSEIRRNVSISYGMSLV